MKCREIKNHIERYIDKSLSASISPMVENHLKMCPDCTSAYDKAVNMQLLFQDDILSEVPDNLAANVIATVINLEFERKKHAGYFSEFMRWWAIAATPARTALSAAVLLFVVAGIFMTKDLIKRPDSLTYMNFSELEAFSATQKGSLEETYFQMTILPSQGGDR
jgi:predicted anti-sigma-YlaC factor YlaD